MTQHTWTEEALQLLVTIAVALAGLWVVGAVASWYVWGTV